MGISLSLLPASDDEIRHYVISPKAVDARFAGVISSSADACHLHERWAALHYLCTGDMDDDAPPLGLLKAGQLEIRGAADPTFGIFAEAVSSWHAALGALTDEEFERRCFRADLLHGGSGGAHVYPGRWPEAMTETLASELRWYFDRLRRFVRATAGRGLGAVFSRYEDY
jgi:Domain of unknown function (DUF1877)